MPERKLRFRELFGALSPNGKRRLNEELMATFNFNRKNIYQILDREGMDAKVFVWFCKKFGLKTLDEAYLEPVEGPQPLTPEDYLQLGEPRSYRMINRQPGKRPRTRKQAKGVPA